MCSYIIIVLFKQEWPICVCYGAIGGYIVGQMLCLSLMFLFRKHKNLKVA